MAIIYVEFAFEGNGQMQDDLLDYLEGFACQDESPDHDCKLVHLYSTSRKTREEMYEFICSK